MTLCEHASVNKGGVREPGELWEAGGVVGACEEVDGAVELCCGKADMDEYGQALEKCGQRPPDLILLDVMMPQVNATQRSLIHAWHLQRQRVSRRDGNDDASGPESTS